MPPNPSCRRRARPPGRRRARSSGSGAVARSAKNRCRSARDSVDRRHSTKSARARASAASTGSIAVAARASTMRGGAGRRRAACGRMRRYSSNCAGRDGRHRQFRDAPQRRAAPRRVRAPRRSRRRARRRPCAGPRCRARSRGSMPIGLPEAISSKRRLPAREPRQSHRAARAGQQSERHFRKAELQVARRAAVVAGERGLRTAAERRAVQRRDHRLAAGLEPRAARRSGAARAAAGRIRGCRRRR